MRSIAYHSIIWRILNINTGQKELNTLVFGALEIRPDLAVFVALIKRALFHMLHSIYYFIAMQRAGCCPRKV